MILRAYVLEIKIGFVKMRCGRETQANACSRRGWQQMEHRWMPLPLLEAISSRTHSIHSMPDLEVARHRGHHYLTQGKRAEDAGQQDQWLFSYGERGLVEEAGPCETKGLNLHHHVPGRRGARAHGETTQWGNAPAPCRSGAGGTRCGREGRRWRAIWTISHARL